MQTQVSISSLDIENALESAHAILMGAEDPGSDPIMAILATSYANGCAAVLAELLADVPQPGIPYQERYVARAERLNQRAGELYKGLRNSMSHNDAQDVAQRGLSDGEI